MLRIATQFSTASRRVPVIVRVFIGMLTGWLLFQLFTNMDLLFDIPGSQFHSLARVKGYATSLAFAPDGKQLVVGTQGDGAQLLSFPDGKVLRTFDHGSVYGFALSPDGQLLVTRSPDNSSISLWRVLDGKSLQTIERDAQWATDMMFSPDGKILAVAAANQVSIFGVDNAKGESSLSFINTINTQKSDILAHSLSFSPDGQLLAVGGAVEAGLWRIADSKLLRTFPGHAISIDFSPDGQWLAVPESASSNKINLWNVSDGTKMRSLIETTPSSDSQQVHGLTISPDGSILATVNIDTKVRIWQTSDETPMRTLDLGRGGAGASIAFSPDNRTLSIGTYERVKIWTLEDR